MNNKTNNILIINGHPDKESYCLALFEAYKKGAIASGANTKEITVAELEFNYNLQFGYRKRTDLEPDLLDSWEKIQWANHLVWIYPVWWGSLPAILKGFIDRVFLPGFTFKKRENSVWWDKLLVGKSAHIISTMDQPTWYYRWINRQPSNHAMKKLTLQFCGVNPVKVTNIGPLRMSKESFRNKWLEKIYQFGLKNK